MSRTRHHRYYNHRRPSEFDRAYRQNYIDSRNDTRSAIDLEEIPFGEAVGGEDEWKECEERWFR